MKKTLFISLLAVFFACEQQSKSYTWMEEIEGEKALSWVKKHNKIAETALMAETNFEKFQKNALKIFESQDRIPYARLAGNKVYNLWKDERNRRGLLRRTSLTEYRKKKVAWEILLDVDQLSKTEKESWVYKKTISLNSKFNRVMISLSKGGKDAVITREFDLNQKKFVDKGFSLPESKMEVTWLNRNELLVGTNFGEGSLTDSGYPRLLKRWRRNTPLSSAKTIFEADKKDVLVYAVKLNRKNNDFIIGQMHTFYETDYYLQQGANQQKLDLPKDIDLKGVKQTSGLLVFVLKNDWNSARGSFKQGSVVAVNPRGLLKSKNRGVELIFEPLESMSVEDIAITKSKFFISVLENVQGKLFKISRIKNNWVSEPMSLPSPGVINIISSSDDNEQIFAGYEDFLTPPSLFEIDGKNQKVIKTLPSTFDSKNFEVKQKWATSKDGTKVPYFLVKKKTTELNGSNPTLLYGYGGFEVSLTPRYQKIKAKLWLEQGGVYALANIRGGGEFGPKWHKAALKKNRWRAYEDFIAIAEDLIKSKITSAQHLGIQGGSNGGLLVGVAMTARPDLFNAVLCQVPLLDMIGYTKLPPGASWIGEYGDPQIPDIAEYIKTYSPFHQLVKEKAYPKVFFRTSTKDDRVHPGHARKMAAKMEDMGHDFFYYENIEGGHGGSADYLQLAKHAALDYSYLWRMLK